MVVVEPPSSTMVIANHATVLDGAVNSVVIASLKDHTLRPSSRLVVWWRGSTGLIVVAHGVERFRFAAAGISDRFGRWGFRCVVAVALGFVGLIGVIVSHGVERFRFAAAAIPDRFGRWGFRCVVVALGFGFIGWA
jgi:uncharacterized membrane protein YidH (DUF202 family)